jgi:CRISPR-associated protein (TIGR03986 family)
MRHQRWRILGKWKTASPLHIGSGDLVPAFHPNLIRSDGSSNEIQGVSRGFNRRCCIPGTAIKGVLRSWAESMLPDRARSIQQIFGQSHSGAEQGHAGWAEFCTSQAKEISDEEASSYSEFVPYWNRTALTGIMSRTSIDRWSGGPAHEKLYFEEFVPEGVEFDVEIDCTRLGEGEISLLLQILQEGSNHSVSPYQFGANSSDGWGRMTWELAGVWRCGTYDWGRSPVGFDCCSISSSIQPSQFQIQEVSHISWNLQMKIAGTFLVNDSSRGKNDSQEEKGGTHDPDLVPLRRSNGNVCMPSSSLRGVLRSRAEFLVRSLHPLEDSHSADSIHPTIARLFGESGQVARLLIEEPVDVSDSEVSMIQDFVAIDRFTGGAAHGALFRAKAIAKPKFKTRLTLKLQGLEKEDLALFGLALDDLCKGELTIGAFGSKGFGEVMGECSVASSSGVPEIWQVPSTYFQRGEFGASSPWVREQIRTLRTVQFSLEDPSPIVLAIPGMLEGRLGIQQGKNGKLKYILSWEVSGKPKSMDVYEQQVDESLRNLVHNNSQVRFNLNGGKPQQIRSTITPGIEPAAIDEPRAGQDQFAHPYYFLPIQNRDAFTGELADSKPVGHDSWKLGRYTGRLKLHLKAMTPLLICDSLPTETDGSHHIFNVSTNPDGTPRLASSSVRGMLRAAFESITNSRFSVFPGRTEGPLEKRANGRRPGFRMASSDSLGMVPVRIENGIVTLMKGTTHSLPTCREGKWRISGPQYAAWVRQYESGRNERSKIAIRLGGKPPENGQHAWCWLELMEKTNNVPFTFWCVREAAEVEDQLSRAQPQPKNETNNYKSKGQFLKAKGYFVISNQNNDRKHDERFFFGAEEEVKVADEIISEYLELIEDCQQIHQEDVKERLPGNLYTPRTGNTASIPALSRHTYAKDDPVSGSQPVFAYASFHPGTKQVSFLVPVMISRRLCERSPLELLPKKLHPATKINELSPADRVFGWVSQDGETAEGNAVSNYRSHVRIGQVTCLTPASDAVEHFDSPITLAILGNPKPQQGRFYLSNHQGRAIAPSVSKQDSRYCSTNRVRGRKIYPHHRRAIGYTDAKSWQDRNRSAISSQKSKQNRSVFGWIKPNTEFTFDLHFTNLSRFELGGLLWLIKLPENSFLRLGLGKPLGFGSVRLGFHDEASVIESNADRIGRISEPNPVASRVDIEQLVTGFQILINQACPDLLRCFLIASRGFDAEVHYPIRRNQEKSNAEHFKWFVENERSGNPMSLPGINDRAPFLKKN